MEIFQIGFAPIFMSVSDMLLFYYLCGGTREGIRKNNNWFFWFTVLLVTMVVSQLVFSGQTNMQANFLIFYVIHFFILLVFSEKCTTIHFSARIYLVILFVLANDICLILLISLSRSLFNIDYIDTGSFLTRVAAHFILLAIKISASKLIKKLVTNQIYGIESAFQAFIIMLPALPYFFLRNYAFLFEINPVEVPLIIHYLNVLFGISAMINMIISEKLSYRIRQNDLLQVEKLIKQQYDHYLFNLKTIDIVNRKYHDLRHIIRGIESMHSLSEIVTCLKSIEEEIQNYELIFNTGNKTLDVILSDRMQESREKGTQMHVHADGQGWDVVNEIDIATIFGNALDNAIESAENNDDIATRFIDVRAGRVNDMLIARFENRFTHRIEKSQSRFISTKVDSVNHGYGLQSIEMIVKKYGGEMDIKTNNGLFTLTIIIPVNQNFV